jgi:hypothetical protein
MTHTCGLVGWQLRGGRWVRSAAPPDYGEVVARLLAKVPVIPNYTTRVGICL